MQKLSADQVPETAAALKDRAALDFPPPSSDFIPSIMVSYGCTQEHALALYNETKRFLVLCASDLATGFVPSYSIDYMWRMFMRRSEKYLEFCALAGWPLGLSRRLWTESRHTSYEETRERFATAFGGRDERFWHPQAGTVFCGG